MDKGLKYGIYNLLSPDWYKDIGDFEAFSSRHFLTNVLFLDKKREI